MSEHRLSLFNTYRDVKLLCTTVDSVAGDQRTETIQASIYDTLNTGRISCAILKQILC